MGPGCGCETHTRQPPGAATIPSRNSHHPTFPSSYATNLVHGNSHPQEMNFRFVPVLSLAVLFCIVALVVSPISDLPVTALKSARVDFHAFQFCALFASSCLLTARLSSIEPVQAFLCDTPASSDELRC